jgi:hypothetical protein
MMTQKYAPFLASAVLMGVLLLLVYPHYQYYIDPDGTAYLTIARRYAEGDLQKAVNGYWSPWGCWLTALSIKVGLAAIPASVVANSLGAVGFLFISQAMFTRCNVLREIQWMLNIALALFLCYAIFWQSFDDLWECFFLLCTVRLMMVKDYKYKPLLWVIGGVFGALAYFAKAYSFPFFILNTLVTTWVICNHDNRLWLRIAAISIGCMLLVSLPWILALHHKYGIWTTSTAGPLNTSWYLVGHPYWKEGIDILLPPPYPDSPYYWEDPYFVNGATPHLWNSLSLLGLQVARIGYNALKFIVSMLQLSILLPVVLVVIILFFKLVWKHSRIVVPTFPEPAHVAGIAFLLFPLGFFLVNFEPRYIWFMIPPGMLLGAVNIRNMRDETLRYVLAFIFPITFVVYPMRCATKMFNEGKDEYNTAQQLKQLSIHGSFTTVTAPGPETQRIERLAYFSGNTLYSIPKINVQPKDILREMRRYHVNYYFVYGPAQQEKFTDEQGRPFPEITQGKIVGLKVYAVNP